MPIGRRRNRIDRSLRERGMQDRTGRDAGEDAFGLEQLPDAAYGVTLCAECGLVSQLHASGGGRLTHFVCVNGAGEVIMPCGRCRQLLFEHGGPDLLLWTVSGVKPMSEVLPDAFGPDDLAVVTTTAAATEQDGAR